MEWLAIAIDAPLLMIALCTYIFFIIKHKEKFNSKNFLSRFGNFGSSFYEKIIKQFTYKKTILHGIFAMLVLHITTESLHFIWPFVFGISDSLYFGLLTSTHLSVFQVFIMDMIFLDFLGKILLIIILAGNIFAILFLLLTPGYLWFLIYKNKKFSLSHMKVGILVSSLIIFVMAPAFSIKPLINELITGVDIAGQSIIQNSLASLPIVVLIALTAGLTCSILSTKMKIEKIIIKIIVIISQIFFTTYITLFTFSISVYYVETIQYLANVNKYFLLIIFVLFFAISIAFYLLGTIGFIKNTLVMLKNI